MPGCDGGMGSILERQFPPLFSTLSAGMEELVGCCVSAAICGDYLGHSYKGDQAEPTELSPAGCALWRRHQKNLPLRPY